MNIGRTKWVLVELAMANTYTHAHTHTVPRYTQDGDKIASDPCSRLYAP